MQDPEVRQYATRVLAKIGEDAIDAVPALIQTLQDPEEIVRVSAAKALGSIGEGAVDAVPALIPLLQDQD